MIQSLGFLVRVGVCWLALYIKFIFIRSLEYFEMRPNIFIDISFRYTFYGVFFLSSSLIGTNIVRMQTVVFDRVRLLLSQSAHLRLVMIVRHFDDFIKGKNIKLPSEN